MPIFRLLTILCLSLVVSIEDRYGICRALGREREIAQGGNKMCSSGLCTTHSAVGLATVAIHVVTYDLLHHRHARDPVHNFRGVEIHSMG